VNVAVEVTHLRRELRAVIEAPRIRIGPKWVEHSPTHPDCYDCIFPAVPAGVTIIGFEYERDPSPSRAAHRRQWRGRHLHHAAPSPEPMHELQAPLNPTQGAYDDLPPCLKDTITPREWQFLSDAQKANYVQTATEPEV
jgi:hypothetical protein